MSVLFHRSISSIVIALAVLSFMVLVTAPSRVYAQPVGYKGVVPDECQGSGAASTCTICHLGVLVINLTNFLIKYIAAPLGVLLILAGGIVILTAGSSENRLKLGKTILSSALIGIIIIMLSWLAVDTTIKLLIGGAPGGPAISFLKNIPGASGFGPWNTIDTAKCNL